MPVKLFNQMDSSRVDFSLPTRLTAFTLAEGATHVDSLPTKRFAFTLAEILITLGVIGIVAAMTIPALMTNYRKHVYANKLKQTYAQLQQSIRQVSEGGGIGDLTCPDAGNFDRNWTHCFHLVMENIAGITFHNGGGSYDKAMCYQGKAYKAYTWMYGGTAPNAKLISDVSRSATMPNGACVLWHASAWAGDARGKLLIDVDGPYSGPNRLGYDTFLFEYVEPNTANPIKDGYIYPYGYNWSDPTTQCGKGKGGGTCAEIIKRNGWNMTYKW